MSVLMLDEPHIDSTALEAITAPMIPYDDPQLFDSTVDRFFRTPFVNRDRIKDVPKWFEAIKASVQ